MNKKGFVLTTTALILIIGAGLALLVGLGGTLKAVSIIKSIPTWAWVGIGILVLFLMLRGKK